MLRWCLARVQALVKFEGDIEPSENSARQASRITLTKKQIYLQKPWPHMVDLIKFVIKFVPHDKNVLLGDEPNCDECSYGQLTKSPLLSSRSPQSLHM